MTSRWQQLYVLVVRLSPESHLYSSEAKNPWVIIHVWKQKKAFPTKCFPLVKCVWETIRIRLSVSTACGLNPYCDTLRHITHSSRVPACEAMETQRWDFHCQDLKNENNLETICWTAGKYVWGNYIITIYYLSAVLLWNSVSSGTKHLEHLHRKQHGAAHFPALLLVKSKQPSEAGLRRPVSTAAQQDLCTCTTQKSDLSILTGRWLHVTQPRCRLPRAGQI